jgi:hypothetical protein
VTTEGSIRINVMEITLIISKRKQRKCTYGFNASFIDDGKGAMADEILGIELVDSNTGGCHA